MRLIGKWIYKFYHKKYIYNKLCTYTKIYYDFFIQALKITWKSILLTRTFLFFGISTKLKVVKLEWLGIFLGVDIKYDIFFFDKIPKIMMWN